MKLGQQLAVVGLVGLMSAAGAVQAAIVINDWKVNLGAIGAQVEDDFTGFGVFGDANGIQEMAFNALFHNVQTLDVAPLGVLSPGDQSTTDVLGQVSNALSTAGPVAVTSTGEVLNVDFELTFASTTTQEVLTANPVTGIGTNTHLGAGAGPDGLNDNGFLDVYADVLTGAGNLSGAQGNVSFTTGGAGLQDGVLIGRFRIIDAGGAQTGSFNNDPASLNGADDATFELVSNPFGALTDFAGVPLALGSTLAFIDSDTDADPDNDQTFDTAPAGWPGGPLGDCPPTGGPTNSCGTENGSFILQQQVPEPGTIALLGLSLLGLAASRRRWF